MTTSIIPIVTNLIQNKMNQILENEISEYSNIDQDSYNSKQNHTAREFHLPDKDSTIQSNFSMDQKQTQNSMKKLEKVYTGVRLFKIIV